MTKSFFSIAHIKNEKLLANCEQNTEFIVFDYRKNCILQRITAKRTDDLISPYTCGPRGNFKKQIINCDEFIAYTFDEISLIDLKNNTKHIIVSTESYIDSVFIEKRIHREGTRQVRINYVETDLTVTKERRHLMQWRHLLISIDA